MGIAIEMARQLNCSDSIWKGMLLHLEYSACKKLHIDIRMPIGMTIEETQRAYCKALGVPCDEVASPQRESSLSRIRTRRSIAPRTGMPCFLPMN
ncbi:MAG: hypothetical protein ACLRYB_07410 [Segatella copri]